MTLTANWTFPTPIRFGPGRIAELTRACRRAGMARPLLVTDPGLAGLPMIAAMTEACRNDGLAVGLFSDVRSNPVEANVSAGVEAFRAGGHDGVIAVGGGSALDCGKLIAFMTAQTRPIWDFEDKGDWWRRANAEGIAPIVAVPTTAGTGSEVGRAGVVTNERTHVKKIIFHPDMLPKVVICDPELTVGLPPGLTAATGMDALSHCLEAYCAPGFHPMADGIAVEGIRLVKDCLPRAVVQGDDIAARAGMMAAAAMGSVAFQKGLGAIHALSHPVGALYDTHHGLTNAVFMPYVLTFNRPAVEARIGRLAGYLGLDPAFDSFMGWVLSLRAELDIPHKLDALGIDAAQADRIAELAEADPTAAGNPVELTRERARAIFEAAMQGTV